MFCFIFISIIININHLYLLRISLSHTLKAFVPYGYKVILSNVCNPLSSSLLNVILSVSSVYTLCASLLSLCCNYNIGLLSNKHFLQSLNLSILFITHFFVPLPYLLHKTRQPLPNKSKIEINLLHFRSNE